MMGRGGWMALAGASAAVVLMATACQGSSHSAAFPHLGPAPVTTTVPMTTTVPVATTLPRHAAQGWSEPVTIKGAEDLASVSCASDTFCMAVDGFTNDYWTFDGHRWSGQGTLSPLGTPVYAGPVSCASAHFCVVMGSRVLVYRGAGWTDVGGAEEVTALSCPTVTFCAGVDVNGEMLTFDGTSLSGPAPLDSGVGLNGISCVASGFCVAVDETGQAVDFVKRGGPPPVGIDPHTVINSVSCASESFCVAVDQSGQAVLFDGKSWSRPVDIDGDTPLVSVDCPQKGWCMAVDQAGQQLRLEASGWGPPETIDSTSLNGVSCPSTSFCAAADDHSAVAIYRSQAPTSLTALSRIGRSQPPG